MRKSKFYIFLAVVTAILLLSTAAICTQCDLKAEEEPPGMEPGGQQTAAEILSITPEEVYEIIYDKKMYYTTSEENGLVYSDDDGDVGDVVGKFVNGKLIFNE